jgi:YVTN family beta-propeller protein
VAGDCCSPDCRLEPDGSSCGAADACHGDEICLAGRCGPPSADAAAACVSGSVVAFVTNFDDDTVAFVDTVSGTVGQTAATGDGPWGVAIHPRGTEVWITDRLANAVSVLDARTGTALATIPVGRLPLGVVLDPTATRAYVATFDDNAVAVIDVTSRAVLGTIGVGHGPSGLAFGPGGAQLYVSNYASNTVSVIDPSSDGVVASVATRKKPLEMALDAARGQLWVTDYDSARVSVIGTFSNTVLATLRVGEKPFGVAVDATGGRVFVTNASSDTMSILDATTCGTAGEVPVGRGPFGVGVDPSGKHVYVANSTNATTAIIDPSTSAVTTNLPVGALPVAFGQFVGAVANDCLRTAAQCDDGNPSTADTCDPTAGCLHALQTDAEVVRAGLAELDATARAAAASALGGGRVAGTLTRLLGEARTQLAAASTSSGAAQRKRLGGTMRRLRRVERAVEKGLRRGAIRCDPGLRMLDLARGTRLRLRALRGRPLAAVVEPAAAEYVAPPPVHLDAP